MSFLPLKTHIACSSPFALGLSRSSTMSRTHLFTQIRRKRVYLSTVFIILSSPVRHRSSIPRLIRSPQHNMHPPRPNPSPHLAPPALSLTQHHPRKARRRSVLRSLTKCWRCARDQRVFEGGVQECDQDGEGACEGKGEGGGVDGDC